MSKLIDLIGLTNIANDIRSWVNAHFLRKEEVPAGSTPSTTIPKMDGVASVGTENAFARGDHRHPSDTGKQDTIEDIDAIRRGAYLGATALQSESDPTVPSWAKQTNKPSYDYSEIGNTPDLSGYVTTSALNTALLSYTTTTDLNTMLGGYQTKIDSTHKLDYSLLDNTPTIPTVPTNVSAFSNDAGYLTQHQSLSGYAKYVLCADEAAYNDISPKQSDTLYLIPES